MQHDDRVVRSSLFWSSLVSGGLVRSWTRGGDCGVDERLFSEIFTKSIGGVTVAFPDDLEADTRRFVCRRKARILSIQVSKLHDSGIWSRGML